MKYFTIKELCASDTAKKLGLKNEPTDVVVKNLTFLVDNVLDEIRERCGFPIRITSGYRCPQLNKAVGGVKTSQHVAGEAVDMQGKDERQTRLLVEIARNYGKFDQLLYERNGKGAIWVHLSFKRYTDKNRYQCIDNYNVK